MHPRLYFQIQSLQSHLTVADLPGLDMMCGKKTSSLLLQSLDLASPFCASGTISTAQIQKLLDIMESQLKVRFQYIILHDSAGCTCM